MDPTRILEESARLLESLKTPVRGGSHGASRLIADSPRGFLEGNRTVAGGGVQLQQQQDNSPLPPRQFVADLNPGSGDQAPFSYTHAVLADANLRHVAVNNNQVNNNNNHVNSSNYNDNNGNNRASSNNSHFTTTSNLSNAHLYGTLNTPGSFVPNNELNDRGFTYPPSSELRVRGSHNGQQTFKTINEVESMVSGLQRRTQQGETRTRQLEAENMQLLSEMKARESELKDIGDHHAREMQLWLRDRNRLKEMEKQQLEAMARAAYLESVIQSLSALLSDSKKTTSDLERVIETMGDTLTTERAKIKNGEETHHKLQSELSVMKMENETLAATNKELRTALSSCQEREAKLKQNVSDQGAALDKRDYAITALKGELDTMTKTLKEVQARDEIHVQEFRRLTQQSVSYEGSLHAASASLTAKDEEISALKEALDEMKARMKSLDEQLGLQMKENSALQQEYLFLQEKAHRQDQLNALQASKEQRLQSEVTTLRQVLKQQQEESSAMESQYTSLLAHKPAGSLRSSSLLNSSHHPLSPQFNPQVGVKPSPYTPEVHPLRPSPSPGMGAPDKGKLSSTDSVSFMTSLLESHGVRSPLGDSLNGNMSISSSPQLLSQPSPPLTSEKRIEHKVASASYPVPNYSRLNGFSES